MKKLLFFLLLLLSGFLSAQTSRPLYQPREIQTALQSGTRSTDGRPGPDYFQNRAEYVIKAEFDPGSKMLSGTETITYENNSRDSLGQLYFNLYQNLYKKGTANDSDIEAANLHDGVEILSVKAGGITVSPERFRSFSTIFGFPLPTKMAPDSKISIEIQWKQKMPETIAKRQGTYQKTNFFIAYWYPKLCVYDDIEGWNTAGHTGQAEFYSDYSDYQVEIIVPASFTVWSSGSLMNGDEIYQDKFLKRIEAASKSDSVIRVITGADRAEGKITRPAKKHTWKYQLINQMDFAFGLSNTYLWDATSTLAGNKRVSIHSVYSPAAVNCNKIPDITRKAIRYYSLQIPALAYPEENITLFEGGPGGMEFPGMINQQDYKEAMETMMVTVHELGHAYLPFYAGINEQKYGWIDEGIFTLIGFLAFCDQAGDKDLNFFQMLTSKYSEDAGYQAVDIPIMDMSYKLGDFTYGFVTYLKPTAAFFVLHDYLGADKFTRGISEFLTRWKGLHPTPYDLFNTFNTIAGEDLAWFWKPWFFEFGYADLAIGKVGKSGAGHTVEILNKGGYPLPVNLTIKYSDGTEKIFTERMNCWKSGISSLTINVPSGEIREILLNPRLVPEAEYDGNRWKQ